MIPFDSLVEKIRHDDPNRIIAKFDPHGGDVNSEVLFLLEAPGPMAAPGGKGSGVISLENDDATARRFKKQIEAAGLQRNKIVIWNIVPWYLGDGKSIDSASAKDIAAARSYLDQLLKILPRLKFVVLVGEKARKEIVYLSRQNRFQILGLHHTSPQSFRVDRRERFEEENMAVLRRLSTECSSNPANST